MRLRIPASVPMPFGFRIKVNLVTDAEMAALENGTCANCHVCQSCRATGATISDGLWQVGPRRISIRKALSKGRQAYMLSHEMGHAFMDWQHHYLGIMGSMKP